MAASPKSHEPPAPTAGPCRVCGQLLQPRHEQCSQCGNPTRAALSHPSDITGLDVLFATLAAITTLAVSLPSSVMVGFWLWNGRMTGGEAEAAIMISSLNGFLIGIPFVVTAWRWRDRIRNDDLHHSIALRDYWQAQATCLIPPAIIIIPVVTIIFLTKYF